MARGVVMRLRQKNIPLTKRAVRGASKPDIAISSRPYLVATVKILSRRRNFNIISYPGWYPRSGGLSE